MKICSFGSLNIDYIYTVEHFVRAGETIPALDRSNACGGKGLNQSIAMAKAGASVYHAGNVGTMDGQILLTCLQANGVDISLVARQNTANGHAIIQVDARGENSILLFGGTNRLVTEEQIALVLSHFEEGDVLVVQNEINMVPQIIRQAHDKGLQIVLNPSPIAGVLETVPLELVDLLFVNEEEARLLGGEATAMSSAKRLRERYPQMTVICTLGRRGAAVYGKEEAFYPAYNVKAVDSTGAGDTFLGFYVGSMVKNMVVEECLKRATAAAALSVQEKGASTSIPSLLEVQAFIAKEIRQGQDRVRGCNRT